MQAAPNPVPSHTPSLGYGDAPPAGGPQLPEANPRIKHWGPASRSQRFSNMVIDWAAQYIVPVAVAMLLATALAIAGVDDETRFAVAVGIGYLVFFGYYPVSEAVWGRTLGKLITGTRVLNMDHRPISIGQALLRTVVRYFVPFEAFSFLSDDPPRGWHDAWSRTQVVRMTPDAFARAASDL